MDPTTLTASVLAVLLAILTVTLPRYLADRLGRAVEAVISDD